MRELKYEIDDSNWSVEEVMEYFGEWLEDEEDAINVMIAVRGNRKRWCKVKFRGRMLEIRRYLMEVRGVGFITVTTNMERKR